MSIATLVTAWVGLMGTAHADESRQIKLDDGRVLLADVASMTAEGMVLSLPQGFMEVRYEQVLDLQPTNALSVIKQPRWSVLVLPVQEADGVSEGQAEQFPQVVVGLLNRIPSLDAELAIAPGSALNLESQDRLMACGTDPDCLSNWARGLDQTAIMVPTWSLSGGTHQIGLQSVYAESAEATFTASVTMASGEGGGPIMTGLYEALGLIPEPDAVAAVTDLVLPQAVPDLVQVVSASSSRTPFSLDSDDLAWVPVPGLPALVRRDLGAFAGTWAVVLPSTLALSSVVGFSAFTQTQFTALSLASYYTVTVAANKAIAKRRKKNP